MNTSPILPFKLVFDVQPPHINMVVTYDQAIRLDEGEFLAEFPNTGSRYICRLTGRTRWIYGMYCPTIERYDIDTVADPDGSIWGQRGQRIPGIWATRPENLVEV